MNSRTSTEALLAEYEEELQIVHTAILELTQKQAKYIREFGYEGQVYQDVFRQLTIKKFELIVKIDAANRIINLQ